MLKAHPFADLFDRLIWHLVLIGSIAIHTVAMFEFAPIHENILGCLVAYFLVDVLTAVGHFAAEIYPPKGDGWKVEKQTYLSESHHTDVLNYSDFTFGQKVSFAYPFILILMLFIYGASLDSFHHTVMTWMTFFGLFVAHIHDWAHRRSVGFKVPFLVAALQDRNLILHPGHHRVHHYYSNHIHFGLFTGHTDFITNYFLRKPAFLRETYSEERKQVMSRLINERRTREYPNERSPNSVSQAQNSSIEEAETSNPEDRRGWIDDYTDSE